MEYIVFAPGVHRGGGRTLLLYLLEALEKADDFRFFLDARLNLPEELANRVRIHWIKPGMIGRLASEWRLRQTVKREDMILCFGNLPPLFRLRGRVLIYIQNHLLFSAAHLRNFPLGMKFRLQLARRWFLLLKNNAQAFMVQTPSMRKRIAEHTNKPILMFPFAQDIHGYSRTHLQGDGRAVSKEFDFIYFASGEPHKNHLNLMHAWCLLAEEGLRPSLLLTLDQKLFPALCNKISDLKSEFGLNLLNIGWKPVRELKRWCDRAGALIFPSRVESLGLPLIEARCIGMPVLAPELDYVRDIVDPEETFDPESPRSISRAVKRHLRIPEKTLPLRQANCLIDKIREWNVRSESFGSL